MFKNLFQIYVAHWIGGRDSLTPSQFSWDYDGEILNSEAIQPFHPPGLQNCVFFYPFYGYFAAGDCRNGYQILCELRH